MIALYLEGLSLSLSLFLCLFEFDIFWDYWQGKKIIRKKKGERNHKLRAHWLFLDNCFSAFIVQRTNAAETLMENLSFCDRRHREMWILHSLAYWNLFVGTDPDRHSFSYPTSWKGSGSVGRYLGLTF